MGKLSWSNVAISAVAAVLIVVALLAPDRVTITVVILFGIAILPWANTFLKSLEIGTGGLKAELNELKQDVAGIADAQSDPDPAEAGDAEALDKHAELAASLTEDQQSILKALTNSKYTLRSLSGLSKETELSRHAVEGELGRLIDKELVNRIHGRKGIRWGISPEGRSVLNQL